MDAAQQKRARIGLIGLVVVIIASGVYVWKVAQPVHATIRGTILSIDVAERTGQIQYVHPKTGEVYELSGRVPAECKIVVDGKPGTLDDLKAGDKIQAEGLVYRTGQIVAEELQTVCVPAPEASQAPDVTTQPVLPPTP